MATKEATPNEPFKFGSAHELRVQHREVLLVSYCTLWSHLRAATNTQDVAAAARELRQTTREMQRLTTLIDKHNAHDQFDRALGQVLDLKRAPCTKKKR